VKKGDAEPFSRHGIPPAKRVEQKRRREQPALLISRILCETVLNVMTSTVQRIAEEVKALPGKELDEFLSWLADYELAHPDEWDKQIERDSQPGGRLDAVLKRVQADIGAGRTKPLDDVIDKS
jgi:hypothetical protein